MKQTAKEQHDKRKEEQINQNKRDRAVLYLHSITRKVPPKAENIVQDKKKDRDYMNFRQAAAPHELHLLKKMVNKELDDENRELLDLAKRVGYLDPLRANSRLSDGNHVSAVTPLSMAQRRIRLNNCIYEKRQS